MRFDRPVDEVFAYRADLRNFAAWDPGVRKVVQVDGRGVIVFNVKGEFYALSETCPHRGGSLAQGIITAQAKEIAEMKAMLKQ